MAKLEEKILQDAAYRPIVFHDQDPHTVISAAREIPAVVDAQGRTNRHDFQVLSISSVALPGWKSGQFLSDGQKVGGHPVTAGAARAPGWHRIESVPRARLPKAAEAGHEDIGDAGGGEARGERLAAELGVPARARDGPNIHELRHVVRAQESDQLLDGLRAVADGANHARAPLAQSAENRCALPMWGQAQACTFARICRRWLRSW